MKRIKQTIEVVIILAAFIIVGYIDGKAVEYVDKNMVVNVG